MNWLPPSRQSGAALRGAVALLCAFILSASAAELNPHRVVVTGTTTIPINAKQVIFDFSSDFNGTIDGDSYTSWAGKSLNWGPFSQDHMGAIVIVVSAGSVTVNYIN